MALIDSKENSVVAVYPQHSDAENAINLLKKSDFNINKLAIISQGYHTENQVVGYYTTGVATQEGLEPSGLRSVWALHQSVLLKPRGPSTLLP